ncbi:pro-pol polyprotein [Plakobranchus ocellatus]|uniref:Pro-pol polyprotein n=1 Tax=Plakobranchus ocellatus TaxID=259542 RepID=A0AAV4D921_9GAST|nr:pro-pol polyprotein [Plakobranchus ocellatus]
MQKAMTIMGMEIMTSTPYHQQSNGMIERLSGSLKRMVNKLAVEKPDNWDKFLPPVLFAFREVPSTSTGYAPFKFDVWQRSPRADTYSNKMDLRSGKQIRGIHTLSKNTRDNCSKISRLHEK